MYIYSPTNFTTFTTNQNSYLNMEKHMLLVFNMYFVEKLSDSDYDLAAGHTPYSYKLTLT